MKSYLRNHIASSIVMLALAIGAAHALAAAVTGGQSQAQAAQQEIAQVMQSSDQQSGQVPTLGQIGQNIGGLFQSMTPR